MAGLSIGEMQTSYVTFNRLDLFSYIGGFSGASAPQALGGQQLYLKTAYRGAMADPAAFARTVHLLWLGVGTHEPARMHDGLESLHKSWRKQGFSMSSTDLREQRMSSRRGAVF